MTANAPQPSRRPSLIQQFQKELLAQNTPFIGPWLHGELIGYLGRSALRGNTFATGLLARGLAYPHLSTLRPQMLAILEKLTHQECIDVLWETWGRTRYPLLTDLLLRRNWEAKANPWTRTLSALRLDRLDVFTRAPAMLVEPLVLLCKDSDPLIASRSQQALGLLKNPTAIDALCECWQKTRLSYLGDCIRDQGYIASKPLTLRVLTALKANRIEELLSGEAEIVAPILAACEDRDPEIATRARQALRSLRTDSAINEFCQQWSQQRSAVLDEALIQARYIAQRPPPIRLLTALKTGRLSIAEQTTPALLPGLLQACEDADAAIAAAAKMALHNLKNEACQEALCQLVIEREHPLAAAAAVKAGYQPETPENRALFFFLTGQWQRYETLDFDQTILRTLYQTAGPELRQRITRQMQQSGRTEYLTVLAGHDYRARIEHMDPAETDLLIRMLIGNQEWERLWKLVFDLPLIAGVHILRTLAASVWQPANENEHALYQELCRLASTPLMLSQAEIERNVPAAISRANLKISSRVNDVALAPHRPLIAIAASQRGVVLWDYQQGKIEKVITGFKHAVGQVAFAGNGWLYCAERSHTNTPCAIYGWNGEQAVHLGQHTGPVTALLTGQEHLISIGRDARVSIWDLHTQRLLTEQTFPNCAITACISPEGHTAALAHKNLTTVSLPSLETTSPPVRVRSIGKKDPISTTARCVTYASPEQILLGLYNGQVLLQNYDKTRRRPFSLVHKHDGRVEGMAYLPQRQILVTAGSEGWIYFINWPKGTPRARVLCPGQILTSLHIAANQALMATGTSDATMALWDLQMLDLPVLFNQPLAIATPNQMNTVNTLANDQALPGEIRNALQILSLLLQQRFRYEIEVSTLPMIQAGEFDVMID